MKINVLCGENRGAHGGDPLRSSGGAARPQGRAKSGAKRRGPALGPCPMRPPSPRSGGPPKRGPSEGRLSFRPKAGSPGRGSVYREGVRVWIS